MISILLFILPVFGIQNVVLRYKSRTDYKQCLYIPWQNRGDNLNTNMYNNICVRYWSLRWMIIMGVIFSSVIENGVGYK
jgi:hypothetical protein